MDQMYRDFVDGQFVPNVKVTRRPDNGHFVATGCGISVTHHDQGEAINRLTARIQEGVTKGEIHPGTT